MENVLGLFAKWPRPGTVKTRLAAQTSPEFAARVAMAFLLDSLERFALVDAATCVLVFAPPTDEPNFARVADGRWLLEPQADGNLGARLGDFFERQFQRGAKKALAVGTDSPTIPPSYIDIAFADSDVVVGPACDGGYYLIGTSRFVPDLFTNIDWSGPDVLRQTLSRLDPKLDLFLLSPWYDVDTLDDWRMLRGHLEAMRRAGIDPLAPRTEALAASGEFAQISHSR